MSDREQADFWRKEAQLCSKDRMYGCAAFALSEYLRFAPDADSKGIRAQIAEWHELGDVAVNDTHAERAARALAEGAARRQRRFDALTRRASTKGLTAKEEAELVALAADLDAPGVP